MLHYIYTDNNGNVTKKPKEFHNLIAIHEEFSNILNSLQDGDKYDENKTSKKKIKNIASYYEYHNPKNFIFNVDDFYSYCYNTNDGGNFNVHRDIQILQCYVPSKGSNIYHKTYNTIFWLDKSVPQVHLFD